MSETQILLLILPIVLIEIVLIVYALRDLLRPERRVRGVDVQDDKFTFSKV